MTEDQFADWLTDNGYAEGMAGYGQATGVEIASALYRAGFAVTACGNKET